MRELATLASEDQATTLTDHLLSLGISTRLDRETQGWVVWVRDEDQMERARQELEAYLREPEHPRYRQAGQAAKEVRKQEERAEREFQKRYRDARTLWGRPAPTRAVITLALFVGCIVITLLTRMGDEVDDPTLQLLSIASYQIEYRDGLTYVRWQGLKEIREGQVWRLITPIFLHFGYLHVIFNMLMLFDLGTSVEGLRGKLIYILLVLAGSIIPNLAQYWIGSPLDWIGNALARSGTPAFGGISGLNCALFSYAWIKGQLQPQLGLHVDRRSVIFTLIFLTLAMTGLLGSIANTAHFVGLLVGLAAGGTVPLTRRLLRLR